MSNPAPTNGHDAEATLTVLRMELSHVAEKLEIAIADESMPPDVVMAAVAMRLQVRQLLKIANPR